jgi:hypothetical protein
VKVEIRLTKEDAALLSKVCKARRCSQSSIIREGLMEWFARRGFLNEDDSVALGFVAQTVPATPASGPGPRLPGHPSDTRWSP